MPGRGRGPGTGAIGCVVLAGSPAGFAAQAPAGYLEGTANGAVLSSGGATFFGSMGGRPLGTSVVAAS